MGKRTWRIGRWKVLFPYHCRKWGTVAVRAEWRRAADCALTTPTPDNTPHQHVILASAARHSQQHNHQPLDQCTYPLLCPVCMWPLSFFTSIVCYLAGGNCSKVAILKCIFKQYFLIHQIILKYCSSKLYV